MFAGAVNCVVATQNGGLCNSERIQQSDVEDNRRFVPSGAFTLWMDRPSKALATTSVSVIWPANAVTSGTGDSVRLAPNPVERLRRWEALFESRSNGRVMNH